MARITGAPAGQATRAASPVAGRLGQIKAWCYDHRRIMLLGWPVAHPPRPGHRTRPYQVLAGLCCRLRR